MEGPPLARWWGIYEQDESEQIKHIKDFDVDVILEMLLIRAALIDERYSIFSAEADARKGDDHRYTGPVAESGDAQTPRDRILSERVSFFWQ